MQYEKGSNGYPGFENGSEAQSKECGQLLEAREGKTMDFPLDSPEGTSHADTLSLALSSSWTPGLQNCENNPCGYESLSLL